MSRRFTFLQLVVACAFLLHAGSSFAQEYVGHLNYNPVLSNLQPFQMSGPAKKTAAVEPLSLPFFEDFTNYGVFPDVTKWTDNNVYINNTMGSKPISRGVATFDALDWRGIPYDSFTNTSVRYADSLTSQPINLSLDILSPGDSIYFSFFFQPQGNGFFPQPQDSLMLFFRTKFGGYVKVWSMPGSTLRDFRQIMIPITDSIYFDSFFQFVFINQAALYWADAVWNVDYIRLDKDRSAIDTAINDIGFTSDPSFLLNDYTSIPYRQFVPIPSAERASQFVFSLRNNNTAAQPVSHAYSASVFPIGTLLKPATFSGASVPALTTQQFTTPTYTTLIPLSSAGYYGKVTFQNKFFIQSISTSDPPHNDTIKKDQVFDNYLAYDDGSAEKSYYLSLYPTLPGRVAVEHHLNRPDTMRGMAIYFGRQVPFAFSKGFDIQVYNSLEGVFGAPADNLLYTKEFCQPGYADTINNFWVYTFDDPLPLPAGTFFAGIFLPAESGSDSLYLGLDVNRIGGNHTYFNVLSSWTPSLISGAVMMRPLLGQPIIGTHIRDVLATKHPWRLWPNPAENTINITYEGDDYAQYVITDIQGRNVLSGKAQGELSIDITKLAPGMYFARLIGDEHIFATQKFIKQ